MPYRVFIGPKGRRVFHCKARTKNDAIRALFRHIDAMKRVSSGSRLAEIQRAEMVLLADSDRIKRERFKPMPSGLHGPLYQFAEGSICTA